MSPDCFEASSATVSESGHRLLSSRYLMRELLMYGTLSLMNHLQELLSWVDFDWVAMIGNRGCSWATVQTPPRQLPHQMGITGSQRCHPAKSLSNSLHKCPLRYRVVCSVVPQLHGTACHWCN